MQTNPKKCSIIKNVENFKKEKQDEKFTIDKKERQGGKKI